tara:strand:- start:118 stop:555 length:438 start_codon:yes stop_codon:yes gene_type:complete
MLVAYILLNFSIKNRYIISLFIAGNILFLASGLMLGDQETGIATVLFGLSSCLILFGCYNADLEKTIKKISFLGYLGKASYSIYLTHTIIISILCKLFILFEINQYLSITFMFLFIAIISTLSGGIIFKYIEKPMLIQMNRRLLK